MKKDVLELGGYKHYDQIVDERRLSVKRVIGDNAKSAPGQKKNIQPSSKQMNRKEYAMLEALDFCFLASTRSYSTWFIAWAAARPILHVVPQWISSKQRAAHRKYKYNRLIWLPRIHLHIFCRQTYTRPNGSKQFEIYLVGEISEESDWTFLGSGNVFFGIIHPKTSTRWELLFEKSYYVCSLEVYLLLLVDMQSAGWEETINHQMYLRYQWNSVDSA